MAIIRAGESDAIWPLVARREIHMRLRSKMFTVSTAVMAVLVVGGVVALHFLSGHTSTYRVATPSATARAIVASAAARHGSPVIESKQYASRAAAESAVRSGKADAALLPAPGEAAGWVLEAKGTPDQTLEGYLTRAVQAHAIEQNARSLGVPVSAVTRGASLVPVALSRGPGGTGFQYGLTLVFGVLFFMSCQLFGTTIANSVVEEKESRVVEVVLAAIPERALLIGKIVGNGLLGIAQMALFAILALAAASGLGHIPHLGAMARSSGWFFVFYVIAFGTVCCLFAGLGALASRTQDLQSAVAPAQLLIVAAYLVAVIGKGALVTVSSFVPVLSAATMPSRIFAGGVPGWQVAASLVLGIAFAVIATLAAARVYRFSVLRTGTRIRLLDSLRAGGAPAPAAAGARPGGTR